MKRSYITLLVLFTVLSNTVAQVSGVSEAYFARLVEVVAGDYPALRAAVGERVQTRLGQQL